MKTIFLMRHGETLFNTMHINQGQCDSPLTENGIRQALAAKEWFLSHDIRFDAVCSSPLGRACDTTELITDMPYKKVAGLKEIYLGTREASPFSENPEYPYGDYFVKYGGEDLDAFTKRFYDAVQELAENEAGNTLLFVSHGMAIKRFLHALRYTGKNGNEILGNCGIVRLLYENGVFQVAEIINPNDSDLPKYFPN